MLWFRLRVSRLVWLMEGSELLEREAKFRQLNKELEKRTRTLLDNIETAMQNQDSFSDISSINFGDNRTSKAHRCTSTPKMDPIDIQKALPKSAPKPGSKSASNESTRGEESKGEKCCCFNVIDRTKGDGWEFLEAFISVNVKDNVLPKSFLKDGTSGESVCKFLLCKVKLLQEQTERLQGVIDKKAAMCELHLSSQADLESQRLQLIQRAEHMRVTADRHASKIQALEKQLLAYTDIERRYNECRIEKDRLSTDVQRAQAATIARSAPLERSVARLEGKLTAAVAANKEFRESARAHATTQQEQIDCLEKQKKALQTTVNKFTQLADNLRRQNSILDTKCSLGALQSEYSRVINHEG